MTNSVHDLVAWAEHVRLTQEAVDKALTLVGSSDYEEALIENAYQDGYADALKDLDRLAADNKSAG